MTTNNTEVVEMVEAAEIAEEVEQIIVLPDLYAPTNKMIPVASTFSKAITEKGFGWNELNLPHLLRVVEREAVEVIPEDGQEKVRQLIANTMVFELPMETFSQISYEKSVSGSSPKVMQNLVELIKEHATLLCAVRLKGSGESRLHNKLSCAFGGHSDIIDYAHARVILDGAKDSEEEKVILSNFLDYIVRIGCVRELKEELRVGIETEANKHLWDESVRTSVVPFGIINSSKSPVESLHMGMINVLAVPDRFGLEVNETDKLEMRRFKLKDLVNKEMFADYDIETWTEISFEEHLINPYALAILRSI
jgi:predicted NUDIX family phosphoesterase